MNRNRNLEHPIPGCLGRMVNLFDLNTSLGANRLLTEKPHYEGSPVSRCQSDVSRTRVVEDRMNDKMILSELAKSPSNKKKSNGTPIKMLIAQEMSKEEAPKQSPSNLVAKLMGLDTLPERHQLGSASYRSNNQRGSRSHSGSLDFIQKEHGFLETREHDEIINQSCKDVFEIWQQSPQKGRHKESKSKNEKNMALVREKFMEAKRLSTNEKLRQSKQFQDALEVLNSNKDLFLKFLQEPNSLFSQHHHLQSSLPPPDSRRITVLRPSKLVDAHKLNKNGKQINEALQMSHCNYKSPTQPTRIVVLKPSSIQPPHEMTSVSSPPSTSNDDGFYGDLEEDTKETTTQSGLRRDENETILSSVFSNGYIGDESSFSKSEVYYAAGNLSDSEVMSPISRHSWDYVNRFGSRSPYSSSSFSRASCSPESSVCREAKKRLSERWAIMSLNGSVQEQRHVRRSSSTLGEMLALSDLKKEEQHCVNRQGSSKGDDDDADSSPKTLVRSKSVPVSSGSIMGQVSDSVKVKKSDTKDLTKEKSVKSSLFKGLFFSKSRKSSKQKSHKDDEHQSSRNIGDDGSECCINDVNGPLRKESCQGPADDLPELGTFGNANENQEQPSPSSVLELQLEEDDNTAVYSCSAKLKEHGVDPIKFNNLIDKSPPIGSISRTLSWDESSVGPVPGKTWSPEEEEQEYFLYVQTLLSVAGINGSSPENPLDPSLRDTYMSLSLTDNHPVAVVHRSKQRQQKSTERLVFDCVNEALRGVHVDRVWERMKEWISGEERCVWDGDDEDGGSMAVERVVRREVVGRGWAEDLGLEIDDIIKNEIEEKLVEELVEELTLDTIRLSDFALHSLIC